VVHVEHGDGRVNQDGGQAGYGRNGDGGRTSAMGNDYPRGAPVKITVDDQGHGMGARGGYRIIKGLDDIQIEQRTR
jgi:hypothetical protein